ncbi:MAG: hypothetical protein ACE5JX_09465 [Acidobacteriota bacterium]
MVGNSGAKVEGVGLVIGASDSNHLSPGEYAILRTVLYSSLFDYPLTPREVWLSLLECRQDKPSILELYLSSSALQRVIDFKDEHFFVRGREDLPRLRSKRKAYSQSILHKNRRLLRLICTVPFTRLVAFSGSAAHLNMDGSGDIDLFVVTRGDRVWSTAMTMLLLARLFGRRKTICFNFLLADTRLHIQKADLFNANQLIHLKPLIGHEVYRALMSKNRFARDYYPNFTPSPDGAAEYAPGRFLMVAKRILEWLLRPGLSHLEEALCRWIYRRHLLRQQPTWTSPQEVILDKDILKLHAYSHRQRVCDRFDQVLREARQKISLAG